MLRALLRDLGLSSSLRLVGDVPSKRSRVRPVNMDKVHVSIHTFTNSPLESTIHKTTKTKEQTTDLIYRLI